jgi:hypothetical protein
VEYVLKQRKLQKVDVEMDDVKVRGSTSDLVEHDQRARGVVPDTGKAECFGSHGQELRGRPRISSGK